MPHYTAQVTDEIVAWVIETDSKTDHTITYLAGPGNHRLTSIQLLNGVDEAKAWAEKKAQQYR